MQHNFVDTLRSTSLKWSSFALLLAVILSPSSTSALELPPAAKVKINYAEHIEPILKKACIRCHGEKKQKSDYRLDSREATLKSGEIGGSIVLGKSAESPFIKYVAGLDEDIEMPPSGDPLTDKEIGLLRAWIDQGLPWSEVAKVEKVEKPKAYKASLKGKAERVTGLALANGSGILAASGGQSLPFRPGNVTLWDINTGKEVGQLPAQASLVWAVAFSPDGTKIATGSYKKEVKVFDVKSGKELATLAGHKNWITYVQFSNNGKILATGSEDATIKLWDIAAKKEIGTLAGHKATVRSLAFSKDDKTLYSGSQDKTVKIWNVAEKKEVGALAGHEDGIFSMSLSSDGKTLATGSADSTIRIWNLAEKKEIKKIAGHKNWVTSVAFSPDGQSLASGSYDKLIKVWEVSSGKEVKSLDGHESAIWSLVYTPDGNTVVSGSQDGTIKIWNTRKRKIMRF